MTTHDGETAYITGAASGIGKAIAELLVRKGIKVFLADLDAAGVAHVATALNQTHPSTSTPIAHSTTIDVTSWSSQVSAFTTAIATLGGRIDHVYPIAGIGESTRWIPLPPQESKTAADVFQKPDLGVLDVDLTGVLYTCALAVQQFRRQEVGVAGTRGKIACVASVVGFYAASTLPMYTTAKHGITGFVRSFGKYLYPHEKVTLNAVCPNVAQTKMSIDGFYRGLQKRGILTPLQGIVDAFEMLLDGDGANVSGQVFEVGPNYGRDGERWVRRDIAPYLDPQSQAVIEYLDKTAFWLQAVPKL